MFSRSPLLNFKGFDLSKGYWIVRVDISNTGQHQQYIAANAQPRAQFGAKFLLRGGVYGAVEGGSRLRNAVISIHQRLRLGDVDGVPLASPTLSACRLVTGCSALFGPCWRKTDPASTGASVLRSKLTVHENVLEEPIFNLHK